MPDEERFLRRNLEAYRLRLEEVGPPDLVVPQGRSFILAERDPQEPGVTWVPNIGRKVRPESWADLKRWVGIPDEVARRVRRAPDLPISTVVSPEVLRRHRRVPEDLAPSLMSIAKGYMFGDSAAFAHYEELLGEMLHRGDFHLELWVPFLRDITIEHDARLIVNNEARSLVARNIYIKTGGWIDVRGDVLNITCDNITGNLA